MSEAHSAVIDNEMLIIEEQTKFLHCNVTEVQAWKMKGEIQIFLQN